MRKRIMACIMCGIRIGASKYPFCIREVPLLMIRKHRPHYFQWSWLIKDKFYGFGIAEMLKAGEK